MASDDPAPAVVLTRDGAEVAVWPLVGPADLRAVEALARLQVAARRRGCTVRLRNPEPALVELLWLVGLAELVTGVRSRCDG